MLRLFSPAKINLFLRVLGKRPDGYHELSSLFQAIDLGDTLDFELSDRDILTCTTSTIPVDETNLVLKAVHLFRRKTGVTTKLKIHLNKHIPIQAGLGGGSSNAATTLWAFNQLMGCIATPEDLKKWSAEIGSDIPFFFSQGTAHCTGRGEHVRHLSPLIPQSCWIVKPHVGLSTPEVYQKLSAQPMQSQKLAYDENKLYYVNDLEKPAFEIKPELKDLKDRLLQCGFDTVLMTGSGSAFFCLGSGKPPLCSTTSIYQTRFLNRTEYNWYENH